MATQNTYAGELATKLQDYRTRGQKEAAKFRPPTEATALDQHEAELKSGAENYLNNIQRQFDKVVTEVSRGATEARQKLIELRATFDQVLRDDTATNTVEAELAGERATLVNATESRLRAEAEIRYFRAQNEIYEEAKYPDSRVFHVGLLMVLALLEILINAFFYENSQGLLGGIVVAAGIALVSIGSSLLLGIGYRYKNLAAIDKKVVGWGCMVAFILFMLLCNSLFASFRSEFQLVADPSEFGQVKEAFQRAWHSALRIFVFAPEFQDHWSFILFGIGIVMSVVAFYKGYTLDDRFPGYGAKDRKYKSTVEQELTLQDAVRQKVKKILHLRRSSVQAAMQEPSTQVGMLARRIAELAHAKNSLESQASSIQRDHSLVAEAYRQANTAIRAIPIPAYFSEPTTLNTIVDGSSAESLSRELSEIQEELKELGEGLRQPLNDKLRELQDNTTDILSNTISAYLKDVQKDAEEKISRTTHVIPRSQAV